MLFSYVPYSTISIEHIREHLREWGSECWKKPNTMRIATSSRYGSRYVAIVFVPRSAAAKNITCAAIAGMMKRSVK